MGQVVHVHGERDREDPIATLRDDAAEPEQQEGTLSEDHRRPLLHRSIHATAAALVLQ